ncbi:MAG: hypothetical protein K5895_01525 [Lachnospiraceae bacterium]|nr:hypothetical protein [Lachnospiraceae bacterium]
MEKEYLDFLRSDPMILTYEIVVLVVLLAVCIMLSTSKKRKRFISEKKQEQQEWNELQEALKNERKK